MAIYYDASEKGNERRGKEWCREGERLMVGNRAFARWRLVNSLVFGLLAVGGFLGVYLPVSSLDLPDDHPKGVGLIVGMAFGGALWSYGRSRYTQRCRKIAQAAEWERLKVKEGAGQKPPGP
jgi:hypothetical protein